MPKLAILIPTYLRPKGLLRALASVIAAKAEFENSGHGCDYQVEVVVGDNDATDSSVAELIEQERRRTGIYIHYICEPRRGIPFVRNALLDYALVKLQAEAVIFIDDDEAAEVDWLRRLVECQIDTASEVVGGRVVAEFETPPPAWAKSLKLYETGYRRTGVVSLIDSTANVLITQACLERVRNPWFNPKYALSGGSDKEFFLRAQACGASFAWCEEATVVELVPTSRANKRWVYQRAYRVGNLDMRLLIERKQYAKALLELLWSAAAFGVSILGLAVLFYSEHYVVKAKRRIYRQVGKLSATVGRIYEEYRTIHGS